MRLHPSPQTQRAFTMVEIAICLAVIGFALVAIIPLLPLGLQVQKDNREDTIINQDGNFFMEAIRSGARGIDELVDSVTNLVLVRLDGTREVVPANLYATSSNIIGILSTPQPWVQRVEADVRAISGSAVEKGPGNQNIGFEYRLSSEVAPFASYTPSTALNTNLANKLQANLHEVRLTFRWPLLSTAGGSGQVQGNNRKVFRDLISGRLWSNNNQYFFLPNRFQPQ